MIRTVSNTITAVSKTQASRPSFWPQPRGQEWLLGLPGWPPRLLLAVGTRSVICNDWFIVLGAVQVGQVYALPPAAQMVCNRRPVCPRAVSISQRTELDPLSSTLALSFTLVSHSWVSKNEHGLKKINIAFGKGGRPVWFYFSNQSCLEEVESNRQVGEIYIPSANEKGKR